MKSSIEKLLATSLELRAVTADEIPLLLAFLVEPFPPEVRAERVAPLLEGVRKKNLDFRGSCGVWRGQRLVGGIFAQRQGEEVLILTAPRTVIPEAVFLLRDELDRLLREEKISLMIMMNDDIDDRETAETFGFENLSPLVSLWCSEVDFLPPPTLSQTSLSTSQPTSLLFRPMLRDDENDYETVGENLQAAQFLEMVRAIEKTYQETQDFPAMIRRCSVASLVNGYRVEGIHDPRLWFFVEQHEKIVGALLLNDHQEMGGIELLYMGIFPEARGKKLGRELIRVTQEIARQRGRHCVVVSVDAHNSPAVKSYRAANFQELSRKLISIRFGETK